MKNIIRTLIVVTIVTMVTSISADTPDNKKEEPLLGIGITGSTPSDRNRNPTSILRSVKVQRMVLDISESPASREEIEGVIDGMFFTVDDMVNVGLLREEDGLFHIDFNLLRVSDQQKILEISERLGRDIAASFLERRSELEALAATHDQPHVGGLELLYDVIGCFSLDWDGLKVTEEMGYRERPQRTIDGKSFTPWAKEKGAEVSLKRLYWGSHNWRSGNMTFTTFGDHHALPRLGLPDLMWQMSGAFRSWEDQPEARRAAGRMLAAYTEKPLEDIVLVMMALRNADLSFEEIKEATGIDKRKLGRVLEFLETADYIEKFGDDYGSRVLVLGAEDAKMVHSLLEMGRQIIVRWHEKNYDNVKTELSDLTPVRNGVPFERVYTSIWHFVFAIANRTLVEEGLFADPYAETRQHKGFIPMVWAKGVSETP